MSAAHYSAAYYEQLDLYERMVESRKQAKIDRKRARKGPTKQEVSDALAERAAEALRKKESSEEEDRLYRPTELKYIQVLDKLPTDLLPVAWGFVSVESREKVDRDRFQQLCSHYAVFTKKDAGTYMEVSCNARLSKIISEIPNDVLVRFIRFGTPARCHVLTTYQKDTRTLYDVCMESTHAIPFQHELEEVISKTFSTAHNDLSGWDAVPTANVLLLSILYVHRKFAVPREQLFI
jgi:hypothetical protein